MTDTTYDSCTLAAVPEKFEVGLQNYAGIIGSAEAMRFLKKWDPTQIYQHENQLNQMMTEELSQIPKLKLIGPKKAVNRGSVLNFSVGERDMAELSLLLDKAAKIMARSGVHCGHHWFHKYDLQPSLRLSFGPYNTIEECEKTLGLLKKFLN